MKRTLSGQVAAPSETATIPIGPGAAVTLTDETTPSLETWEWRDKLHMPKASKILTVSTDQPLPAVHQRRSDARVHHNPDLLMDYTSQRYGFIDEMGAVPPRLWHRRDWSDEERRSRNFDRIGGNSSSTVRSYLGLFPEHIRTGGRLERATNRYNGEEAIERRKMQTDISRADAQTLNRNAAVRMDDVFIKTSIPKASQYETTPLKMQAPSLDGGSLIARSTDCSDERFKKALPPHRKASYRKIRSCNSQAFTRGSGVELDPRRPPFVPGNLENSAVLDYTYQQQLPIYDPYCRHSQCSWRSDSPVYSQLPVGGRVDPRHWDMYRLGLRSTGNTAEDSTRIRYPLNLSQSNVLYCPFSSPVANSPCETPTPHTPYPQEQSSRQYAILGSARAAVQIPAFDPRLSSTSTPFTNIREDDYFGNSTSIHGNHTLNQLKIVLDGLDSTSNFNSKSTVETLWGLMDCTKMDMGGSLQTRLHRLTYTITDTDRLMVDVWRVELWTVLAWIAGGGTTSVPILQFMARTEPNKAVNAMIEEGEIAQVPGNVTPIPVRERSCQSDNTITPEQGTGDCSSDRRTTAIDKDKKPPVSHVVDVFETDLAVQNFFLSPQMDAYVSHSHQIALGLQMSISLLWKKVRKVFTREWEYGISKHARRGVVISALRNVYEMRETDVLWNQDLDSRRSEKEETPKKIEGEGEKPLSRVWDRRSLCVECEPEALAEDGYFLTLLDKFISKEVLNMERVEKEKIKEDKGDLEPLLLNCPSNSITRLIKKRGARHKMRYMESCRSGVSCCTDTGHSANIIPLSPIYSQANTSISPLFGEQHPPILPVLANQSQTSQENFASLCESKDEELAGRQKLHQNLAPRIIRNIVLDPIFDKLKNSKEAKPRGEDNDSLLRISSDVSEQKDECDGVMSAEHRARLIFLEMLYLDRMVFMGYVVQEVLKVWQKERGGMGKVWWKFPKVTPDDLTKLQEWFKCKENMEGAEDNGISRDLPDSVNAGGAHSKDTQHSPEHIQPQVDVQGLTNSPFPGKEKSALATSHPLPDGEPVQYATSTSSSASVTTPVPPTWSEVASRSHDTVLLTQRKSAPASCSLSASTLERRSVSVSPSTEKKIPPHRKPAYVSLVDTTPQAPPKTIPTGTVSSQLQFSTIQQSPSQQEPRQTTLIPSETLAPAQVLLPPHKKQQGNAPPRTYASVASGAVVSLLSSKSVESPSRTSSKEIQSQSSSDLSASPLPTSDTPTASAGEESTSISGPTGVLASSVADEDPIEKPVSEGPTTGSPPWKIAEGITGKTTPWNPPTRPRFMSYSEAASSAIRASPIRPMIILKRESTAPSKILEQPVVDHRNSREELAAAPELYPLETTSLLETENITETRPLQTDSSTKEANPVFAQVQYRPKLNTWLAVSSEAFRVKETPSILAEENIAKHMQLAMHETLDDNVGIKHGFRAGEIRYGMKEDESRLDEERAKELDRWKRKLATEKEEVRKWILQLEEWLWIYGEGIGIKFIEGKDEDNGHENLPKVRHAAVSATVEDGQELTRNSDALHTGEQVVLQEAAQDEEHATYIATRGTIIQREQRTGDAK